MDDFIKAKLEVDVFDRVRKLTNEKAELGYYPDTGELRSETLTYKNLKFKLVKGKHLNLTGSIHKFKNDGKHNFDQFGIDDVKRTIQEMEILFGFDSQKTILSNLEFGVNVLMPFNVRTILDSIISYKGEETMPKKYKRNGYLLRVDKTQYEIKIYDKGTQYNTGTNILRFEIKVRTMQYLNSKGISIKYLSDLINPEIIKKLGILLSSTVKGLLIYPIEYDLTNLNQRDRETFLKGRDKTYLMKIPSNNRKKKIKRLRELFKKVSTPEFTPLTSKLILDQWLKLSKPIHEVKKTLPNLRPSIFTHSYTSYSMLKRVMFSDLVRQDFRVY